MIEKPMIAHPCQCYTLAAQGGNASFATATQNVKQDGSVKKILNRAKQEIAYYRALFTHPRTPRISRWLLGGAIAYLVSPIDIIPDFVPILGQLDDILIVPSMIYAALSFIPASVKAECREKTANQVMKRNIRLHENTESGNLATNGKEELEP